MNLSPTGNRILIRPDPEVSSSVVIVPEAVKKFANRGRVVAVGPGRRYMDGKLYPPGVTLNQIVMFSKLRAFPFRVDIEDLVLVDDDDVLCVIEE